MGLKYTHRLNRETEMWSFLFFYCWLIVHFIFKLYRESNSNISNNVLMWKTYILFSFLKPKWTSSTYLFCATNNPQHKHIQLCVCLDLCWSASNVLTYNFNSYSVLQVPLHLYLILLHAPPSRLQTCFSLISIMLSVQCTRQKHYDRNVQPCMVGIKPSTVLKV